MTELTAHLGLPLIAAAQAQKHVTHNEAIVALDAIVQLSVKDSTHTAPPAAAEGDRYKVASGATGAWAGWDLNIALYTNGAWTKLVPQKGWLCFDEASGALTVWQGAPNYWVDPAAVAGYLTAATLNHAGCGQLRYVSATQIRFAPFNGDRIKIAGAWHQIPPAGVAAGNTGVFVEGVAGQNLFANTTYYVYLFNNSGAPTINFSTVGHGTSSVAGNVGVETKVDDNSLTLIGMIRTNASGQFQDSAAFRGVASWFNRRNRALAGAALNGAQTTSINTFVELSAAARAQFLTWGDEDIKVECVGQLVNSAGNVTTYSNMGNGTIQNLAPNAAVTITSGNVGWTASTSLSTNFAEGFSYLTPTGCVSNPSTGTYYTQIIGMLRI